ncbi:MAG: helix-turn-helix transcriptional regulator [Prevotellaceae bacterium]|jgi:transcriptional regulator with XRE-family HTH domain|nr:helix-turn-helix transcriptional regulator [Prevotellaceae bacterium]
MEEKKELDALNKRFIEVMKWTKLPQGKFAESIGITQGGVSHITSGRSKPSINSLTRIHEAYPDINYDWLLTGKGEMLLSASGDPDQTDGFMPGSLFSPPANPTQRGAVREKPSKNAYEATGNAPKEIAKQEVIYQEQPQRKITEIRIFFDDNTFEIFKPEK